MKRDGMVSTVPVPGMGLWEPAGIDNLTMGFRVFLGVNHSLSKIELICHWDRFLLFSTSGC